MRLLFAGVVLVCTGSGGCALVTGLSDYAEHTGESADSSVTSLLKADAAVTAAPDAGGSELNDESVSIDTSDAAAPSDAERIVDGSGDAAFAPDVNTTCDTATCAGCCSNGECVGGQSVATCGVGGVACKDCTNMGGACTRGACTMKVADASAPTCTVSKCGGCIPFYQTSCCKADQTCGCVVSFSGGSCK